MAQDTWINISIDVNVADPTRQRHRSVGGANDGSSDLTLAWTAAKLGTNLNTADAIIAELRRGLQARGFK